jgi:hypothetical protein
MDRARGQNNTIIIFKKRWRGGRDLILIMRRTIKELIVEDVVTGGVLFIKLISTRPSPSIAKYTMIFYETYINSSEGIFSITH